MVVSKLATIKDYSWQSSGHFGQIPRKPIDMIVLHHNDGTNFDAVPNIWLTREASAHYQIGPTQIKSCLDESITAWHCGANGYDNNSHTIGIEHVNSTLAPDYLVDPRTEENSAQLVVDIATRYNIPIDRQHIVKHKEMPGCQTDCCGGLRIDWIVARALQIVGKSNSVSTAPEKHLLNVDGLWGLDTWHIIQRSAGLSEDNVISSQSLNSKKLLAGITMPVEYVLSQNAKGSLAIQHIQKYFGSDPDGLLGIKSIKDMQTVLKKKGLYSGLIDGTLDKPSQTIIGLQKLLNLGIKL